MSAHLRPVPAAEHAPTAPGGTAEVAVVVVSYNTRAWLERCLAALPAAAAGRALEVVVVDNASADGSADLVAERFPDVRLVRSPENLGFARAVNLGVAATASEHVLLVNPDGELRPGAVDALVRFADAHPEHVVCGGRTVSPSGELDPRSCWSAPSLWSLFCSASMLSVVFRGSRLFDPEAMPRFGRDHERDVDIVSGCLLLVRRGDWEALGGFDERFFMYGEDADLCLRASADGRTCAVTPGAEMVHAVGASSAVRPDKVELVLRGRIALVRKHWPRRRAALGVALMVLGVWARAVAERLVGRHGGTWSEVWARRTRWRGGWEPIDGEPPPAARSSVPGPTVRVARLVASVPGRVLRARRHDDDGGRRDG